MPERERLCGFLCLHVTSFGIAVVAVPGPKMSDAVSVAADVAAAPAVVVLNVSFVYIRFVQTHKGNAYINRAHHTY